MDRMLVVVFDSESKAYEGKRALSQLDSDGSILRRRSCLLSGLQLRVPRLANLIRECLPTAPSR